MKRALDAVADDRLDLALMPVAGVSEHDSRLVDLDPTELALRGADHRLEVAEVRRVRGQFGGDDDLRSLTASCAL